jgi:hypothetical protein
MQFDDAFDEREPYPCAPPGAHQQKSEHHSGGAAASDATLCGNR